ncbi:dnaJ homolog subfamily C member 7-like isoform X1 [Scylla paramamosain]|uniref:dnaJ homolog subfamily C member 7-like isoform X1 n=1 Tax=Scylla paramamosain TaxID=85552 RepID=UPI003082C46F
MADGRRRRRSSRAHAHTHGKAPADHVVHVNLDLRPHARTRSGYETSTPTSTPAVCQDALDPPPKYDDIFSTPQAPPAPTAIHHAHHKRRLKACLLKHLARAGRGRSLSPTGGHGARRGRATRHGASASPPTPKEGAAPASPRPSVRRAHSERQEPPLHLLEEEQKEEGGGGAGHRAAGRRFTLSLKPGHYQVSVRWRARGRPLRLTLTPRDALRPEAPPPQHPQPLYYGSSAVPEACPSPAPGPATPSLPRRLVSRLLAPRLLLQQQVGVNPAAASGRRGSRRRWGAATHTPRPRKGRHRLAERKKNEGNELYKTKEYRDALRLYTQAIDLCPDCAAYYSNRSACYMMLGKYTEALNDAREAVRLDKTFVKGYIRVAKCNIALGDATAALSVLREAGELEAGSKAVKDEVSRAQALIRYQDEIEKAFGKGDYRTAIFHLDRALEFAVGCRAMKIRKAEYLVMLQRYSEAQEMVNEILQFDNTNVDAIYVRGMCLYYQDNPEVAFNHFQHVLRLAPDHHKAKEVYKKAKQLKQKKEEGNEAFRRGRHQEALTLYTEALAIDPLNQVTNAKLYFNRATVNSKLNRLEQATEDCTAAINLDDGYLKAFLRRAKCNQQLERHEEAVRDYEKVLRLDKSPEHKRMLQEAKVQLKRSKRKDYYKILGVNKNATEDEIKKNYKKMALVHHPDRHSSASEQDKRDHEVKFKEIGEAYSVLTDTKKRAMYDRGHDFNDPDGGFAHEDIDPSQIFQAFFGGGQGGYTFSNQGGSIPATRGLSRGWLWGAPSPEVSISSLAKEGAVGLLRGGVRG